MKWKPVAAIHEIHEDQLNCFQVDGRAVLVYCKANSYFVYPDLCTHENVPLSDGFFSKGTVICRLHGAKYDLQSGACLKAPARADLIAYPTLVAGDILYIDSAALQQTPLSPPTMTIRSRKPAQWRATARHNSVEPIVGVTNAYEQVD